LHITYRQPLAGLLCASLAGLTGCATTAELDELRAEIARANAIAASAREDLARTQVELAALKAETKQAESPPDATAKSEPAPASPSNPAGYKWGSYKP
jgi:outer membrane protein TolC